MITQRLIDKLTKAKTVVIFTGAGMSAESGIPTFRGEEGIWKNFKPEELASFNAFIKNTEIVWEWYKHRKQIIAKIQPNAGHFAVAEMEHSFPHIVVITQNIDNLHARAGSTTIHELHGNIDRNYCIGCGKYFSNEEVFKFDHAPRCRFCNGRIRPDVVWFGEMLPEEAWNASVAAAERCDMFLVVGTSSVVYPAASLPMIAKRAGAYVVEINLEPTELSPRVDEFLTGKAGEILPRLLALRQSTMNSQ